MNHRFTFPPTGDWGDDFFAGDRLEQGLDLPGFDVAAGVVDPELTDACALPGSGSASLATYYRPEGYEPKYAYPLLVWFHDSGEAEGVLHSLMPRVSDRNAIGLALRGEWLTAGGGYTWAAGATVTQRLRRLENAVQTLRRECHLHTERVVLAGRGAGAAAAAEVFFARPEWFGGLALFDPPAVTRGGVLQAAPFQAPPSAAEGEPLAADKPVLLGVTDAPATARGWQTRLESADLAVTLRDTGHLTPDALRHLDRWLLSAVCGVA